MKLFLRFFVLLCLLLWGGYGHADASRYRNHGCYAPLRGIEDSKLVSSVSSQNTSGYVVRSAPAGNEDQNDKIDESDDDDDDEDDKLIVVKKYLAVANYFTDHFSPRPSGDVCTYVSKRPSYCRHFSYLSSSRYIVFRTIRV